MPSGRASLELLGKTRRTLNLSEDIFAGLDFVLRGDGREICHKEHKSQGSLFEGQPEHSSRELAATSQEYFHLAKGRDLGFNSAAWTCVKAWSWQRQLIITKWCSTWAPQLKVR